jgi:hypothetical protein
MTLWLVVVMVAHQASPHALFIHLSYYENVKLHPGILLDAENLT